MEAKIAEAQEHTRKGEKYLKLTLFRWAPDYQSAADAFIEAAKCYRIAGDLSQAKLLNLRASNIYRKTNSFFHAAKAVEDAISQAKEQNNLNEMYDLALHASMLYRQHGSADAAASVLGKVGKMLETSLPQNAIALYQNAVSVSANECDDHQSAIAYCAKATKQLIRCQSYDLATESITQEMQFHKQSNNNGAVGRLCVGLVLVHLARGDTVAAARAYQEWGNCCENSEVETIGQLLTAFEEQDRDGARAALDAPFIRYMDIEYSRLARKIPLPGPHEPPAVDEHLDDDNAQVQYDGALC